MSKYYYLVAQLPHFDVGPAAADFVPMKFADFHELSSRFLTEKDKAILDSLSLEPQLSGECCDSRFVAAWDDFEKTLRVALAQVRAGAMKKTFEPKGDAADLCVPQNVLQIAKNACACENPLDAEKMLNAERLRFLNENTPLDAFCSDAVFAYGLRLLMAERIAKFNREAGSDSYHAIYNQILGDAK